MHKRVLVIALVAFLHSLVLIATLPAREQRIDTTIHMIMGYVKGGSIVDILVICVFNVLNAAATRVNNNRLKDWIIREVLDENDHCNASAYCLFGWEPPLCAEFGATRSRSGSGRQSVK